MAFQTFFAPFLFHRSRNNRRDKLRSKFWHEKVFRKPHLKLLRWCSIFGTNKFVIAWKGSWTPIHSSVPTNISSWEVTPQYAIIHSNSKGLASTQWIIQLNWNEQKKQINILSLEYTQLPTFQLFLVQVPRMLWFCVQVKRFNKALLRSPSETFIYVYFPGGGGLLERGCSCQATFSNPK